MMFLRPMSRKFEIEASGIVFARLRCDFVLSEFDNRVTSHHLCRCYAQLCDIVSTVFTYLCLRKPYHWLQSVSVACCLMKHLYITEPACSLSGIDANTTLFLIISWRHTTSLVNRVETRVDDRERQAGPAYDSDTESYSTVFFFSWHERCHAHHWSPGLPIGCLLPCRREADIQWLQIRLNCT